MIFNSRVKTVLVFDSNESFDSFSFGVVTV